MKRLLVVLLVVAMLMGMVVPVYVSAEPVEVENKAEPNQEPSTIGKVPAGYTPQGTEIKDATQFNKENMTDGDYYLGADITVDTTIPAFKGTFDGNGHTITTSVPLFDKFDGTAKNLIIKGTNDTVTITEQSKGTSGYSGVFANLIGSIADTTIENICNKANISSTVTGVGGIIGKSSNVKTYKITITNCANYGNISNGSADSGGILARHDSKDSETPLLFVTNCYNYGEVHTNGRPGGVIGTTGDSAEVKNCYNEGNVTTDNNYCGGVIGRICDNCSTKGTYLIQDCVNTGTVTTFKNEGGGIVGFSGGPESMTFINCKNTGAVVGNQKEAPDVQYRIGGILGNCDPNAGSARFENCINEGNIGDTLFSSELCERASGGIAGKIRVLNQLEFINCHNTGNMLTDDHAGGIAGWPYVKKGNLIFRDCTNKCETIVSNDDAGGIVGYAQVYEGNILFENCKNDCANIGISGEIISKKSAGIASKVRIFWGVKDNSIKFINCESNSGNINAIEGAGGIGGWVIFDDKTDIEKDGNKETIYHKGYIEFINCINRSSVNSTTYKAGGICCESNGRSKGTLFEKCCNYGNVTAKTDAAGLTAYEFAHCIGPKVINCITTGNISGGGYVSGLIGYMNCWANAEFRYNIVAGNITGTENKIPAENKVVSGATYSYTGTKGTRYFIAPQNGTVEIQGDKVRFTSTGNILPKVNPIEAKGGTVKGKQIYKFSLGNNEYVFDAREGGTVVISGDEGNPTIKLNDKYSINYMPISEWEKFHISNDGKSADLVTYDCDVSARALYWSNQGNLRFDDLDKNFIADSAGGLAYASGFCGSWSTFGDTVQGTRTPAVDFSSGKVAYELNDMNNQTVFYQNIGTDNYPVTDISHSQVYWYGGNEYGNTENLDSISVSLKDKIGLNFYIHLSAAAASDPRTYVKFTVPNGNKVTDVYVKDAVLKEGYYVFSCPMVAKEMADTVQAQLFIDSKCVATYKYSIRDYCDKALKQIKDPQAHDAIISMLNYGAAAQQYFGYKTGDLANKNLTVEQKKLTQNPTIINELNINQNKDGDNIGISKISAVLNLKSGTGIKFYFVFENGGKAENYTFSYEKDGSVCNPDPFPERGRTCIEIPDIYAKNLGKPYILKVINKTTGKEISITFSALTYCNMVLSKTDGTTELHNLAKALYDYNQKAISYAGVLVQKTYTERDMEKLVDVPDPEVMYGGKNVSCTAMQGLNVGTKYIYTVKYHYDNNNKELCSAFTRTDVDNKSQTVMEYYPKPDSQKAEACEILGHANDMTVCGINENGKTVNYMYVATLKYGPAIARLKIDGDKMYPTGFFNTVTTDGRSFDVGALKYIKIADGKIYFLVKSGRQFYYCIIDDNDNGGSETEPKQVVCYKIFNIYTKNARISTDGVNYKTVDHLENWTNQGFGYSPDEGAIYVPLYNQYGNNGKNKENLILVYKIGEYISETALKNPKDAVRVVYPCTLSFHIERTDLDMFEIESCGFRTGQGDNGDKKLYFNVNAYKKGNPEVKDGLYYINYKPNSRNLIPLPAEKEVITYKVVYDDSLPDSVQNSKMDPTAHIYGFADCLRKNTFTREGYTFAGWYLSRQSDSKWLYIYNKEKHWYIPGDQPAGAYLALYKDSCWVSALTAVNGDMITCHAQWTPDATGDNNTTFYIQYNENGGTGPHIPDTKVVCGEGAKITTSTYSRPGYVFSGWIAHRRSDNKFIYKDSSGKDAWRENPDAGYFLKAYNSGCSVSKTSNTDRDIITFYAAWTKINNFTGPEKIVTKGSPLVFGGTVESDAGIYELIVSVKDSQGIEVLKGMKEPKQYTYDLAQITMPDTNKLVSGATYTFTVTATTLNNGTDKTTVELCNSEFVVK